MRWLRNILFLGLVIGAIGAVKVTLFPRQLQPRVHGFSPQQSSELAGIVKKVDAAFESDWAKKGLEPAPRAADLAVARRLSLALTGTIPSLQEIRQLEAYSGDQRIQWWLTGLFQDRRYGDYLAERLARTYVGAEDGPFLVYRRRRFLSWLSDQLMQEKQDYGALVRELISAQGLWTDKPATNFLTVTNDPKTEQPNPERLAGRVARAFLGIRLDCAQCHDHFFEDWKQRDFQGLAAFFGQTHQGFTGIYDGTGEFQPENRKKQPDGTVQLVKETVPPGVPFYPELLPKEGTRRQQLARWVTDPKNKYFARATVQRVWALMFGRPLLDSVESMSVKGGFPEALELLADDFIAHDYDLRRLVRVIAATRVFQLSSAFNQPTTDEHLKSWAVFPVTRLRPEQVAGSILQASSLKTVNHESHILVRFARYAGENDFVHRYGDTGEDEFDPRGGTIPQRLLMMNGDLVKEKTRGELFNAATQIGNLSPNDRVRVETAFLAVLTRRPTTGENGEAAYFDPRMAADNEQDRGQRLEDLYWVLINSTEFSWNH